MRDRVTRPFLQVGHAADGPGPALPPGHYTIKPLVEPYGSCMVALKVSCCGINHGHQDADCLFGPELNFLEVFYFPQDTPAAAGPTEVSRGGDVTVTLTAPLHVPLVVLYTKYAGWRRNDVDVHA